jgi:hypothetical protein
MEPCKIRGTTQPLVSRTGAGRQGNIFSFRSRKKNVLDFSSYRSGFNASLHPIRLPGACLDSRFGNRRNDPLLFFFADSRRKSQLNLV